MSRLDFANIFKRSSCLNSTESKIDSEKIFTTLEGKLESIKNGYIPVSIENSLRSYTESLANKDNASSYWYRGLEIISTLDKKHCNKYANKFLEQYTSRILPYVENIGGVLEAIDRYELDNNQADKIKNICENYKLADKIINNHNQISKRFNIEYEVKSAKIKGISSVVESCCSMIDTYSYEPYQKMNMCIEEIVYLFEKNNIDYAPEQLLSSVVEYFLLRSPELSDRDIKGYRYVMEHNQCIDDTSSSRFLFEDFNVINIKSAINDYLKIQNKTPEITEEKFISIINSTSITDLKNNTELLLDFLYRLYASHISQDNGAKESLEVFIKILYALVARYEKEALELGAINRDDIIQLIATFEREKAKIQIGDVNDPFTLGKLEYKNILGSIITTKLADISNSIYSKDNIKAIDFVNSEDSEEIGLREFKIFKFNNIIKATVNLDKYLKSKIKGFMGKNQRKIRLGTKKIKNILFDENGRMVPDSIYTFIGDDNKVDICLCQIEVDSDDEISEIQEELTALCKGYNNELNVNGITNVKSYYLINGCIAEVHLKDCTKVILTEEEQLLVNRSYNPSLDVYIEQLALFDVCSDIAESFDNKTLDEKIASIFVNEDIDFTLEAYDAAMDALSLLEADKNQVDMFTEAFSRHRSQVINESSQLITENRFIKSIYNNWESEHNVPYDIQIEAYQLFNDIINEAAPKVTKPKVGVGNSAKKPPSPIVNKKTDNNSSNKGDDYNPSSSMSNKLNNIKIYLQGLKGKMKGMNQKEKEMSRNLDANFNNLAKSIKNAFISDRREAIIKGSVIPSFSKAIKTCITLAGLGIVTQNPIVPIVAALGGLAVSKKLTKRERILLLDEIETELDVVEKEIAIADSKNQIKKYRALLQYKKNLQRQYQRIKYNVRVGKDILPGSAAGFKEKD